MTSATVEFVFAPAERDVYSHERTPKDIAPLGAKPGSGTFARQAKRLRSCSENKCALRAHKTDPNISSEEQGMIVSRSTTAVPRLTGGRPSKEILIIEATIRNPIFMFGGAPQAHVELRSFRKYRGIAVESSVRQPRLAIQPAQLPTLLPA